MWKLHVCYSPICLIKCATLLANSMAISAYHIYYIGTFYISLDDTPLNIKISTSCYCNMPVYFHYSSQVSCSACNDQSDITSQVFLLVFSLSFDIPMKHNKNTNILRRECRKENIDIYAWHNFYFYCSMRLTFWKWNHSIWNEAHISKILVYVI